MLTALVICRAVHYGAAMLLFGSGFFAAVLARPSLGPELEPTMRRVGAVTIPVLGVTSLAWLLLVAGMMGDGWPDAVHAATVRTVLFDTGFGRAWQLHLGLAAALLASLGLRAPARAPMRVVASGLFLASLSLVGHAVMRPGAVGWWHKANLALHLLAAGTWLGSLVPLLSTMAILRDPLRRRDAAASLRRFSGAGHVAVALVVLTGIVNTLLVLGRWPTDWASPYRAILGAKIMLVAIMIAAALFNRYVVVPSLGRSPGRGDLLRRITLAELGLGACVLAVVSLLGELEPA